MGDATLILTHGAGSNRDSKLLLALDREFSALGFDVHRINLAFREAGRSGPPRPADSALDRAGLATAVQNAKGRIYLGGHSYGGRQASMLLAEQPDLPVAALLLLSYPLHPPAKPQQLRTAHLPNLRTPVFFASGGKDEFGSPDELAAAVELIAAPRKRLRIFPSLKHDLGSGAGRTPAEIAAEFQEFAKP